MPSRKPSILFHYPVFNVGGAEKSSLRMMQAFIAEGWDVTLVLTVPGGNMEHLIPQAVKVKYLRNQQAGHAFFSARGMLAKLTNLSDLTFYIQQRWTQFTRQRRYRTKTYDVAVALLTGMSTAFIRNHIRATKKVLWIRNDLKGIDKNGVIAANIAKVAHQIDLFICVSQTAKNSLVEAVPAINDKAHVVYNLLFPDEMKALADVCNAPPRMAQVADSVKILTVCRLSDTSKAIYRMARVCQYLKNKGLNFTWFVIGDGPDREELQRLIQTLDISSHLILLGRLENPFPAYKAADIVAVVSYYEGLCGIVNEAKILGKAVVAAEVSGIHEQLIHEQTGLICENEEGAIGAAIERLLIDSKLRNALAESDYSQVIVDDAAKMQRLFNLFDVSK